MNPRSQRRWRSFIALTALTFSGLCFGDDSIPAPVLDAVGTLLPNAPDPAVTPAPVDGMFQVVVGPHLFYISADGRYMIRGDIMDLASRRNLSARVRSQARADAVEALGEESMIVFAPEAPTHTVTVFTDVDCGYCAKLHREMDDYLAEGIAIRYLAFPRAGVQSSSFADMVSVWCADDQRAAMTAAKARRPVEPRSCENPVAEHYEMGQLVGVRGTPTIVMETGDLVPGYLPAKRLKEAIMEAKANVAQR